MKAEWTNRDNLSIETTSQNSKAVLVIDMPKNCEGCRIRLSGEPNEWCWYLRHGLDDIKAKPSWCPLKPLPHKLQADWYTDGYKEGFNACLEEITGETE